MGINIVLLLLVWVLLNGNLRPMTLAGGLLLSLLVSWAFPLPPIQWKGRLRPLGFLKLLVRLLLDLAVASFRLAAVAFARKPRPASGVVRVPLASDGDLYQVGTASLLSIVPGSVVVDARRKTRTLYLHVFDMTDADAADVVTMAQDAEARVLGAFASSAEIKEARGDH